ncbi:MAG: uroporphyrinogen-III C-methyltransferase [Enterobacter sp.]|nr:uroporphyrinogen-III C-methyltransferase [Enterobacter sp.]
MPLFAAIKEKPVLVVGTGEIADRKIAFLQRAGAQVRVVAEADFDESQIDSVVLVIAATEDRDLNRRISDAAQARYRLVNVVDDQPLCSFIFPSIVDRSPLLVAISSGGTAPVLARVLREKIEALLPTSLGRMAEKASYWRNHLKTRLTSVTERRRFWERVFRGRFASLMHTGNETAAQKILEDELEQDADVVFYDHLVTDGVRELIRRDAEQICVGKRASEHSVPQHDTNQMLVDAAKAGKTVVRLKGGDPFIFGRGGEELQAAAEAGIPFQVVPGITAASAVTAYAGIPLTHRDYAQSVTFVTGHYKADSTPFDWSHLAQSRQTLAIYMGTMKAADISEQLIQHGREATTPVAVISRGTRVDQHVATGTLEHLATLAKDAPMPALIVVGEVVQLHSTLAWFQHTTDTEGFGSSVVNLA